MSLDLIAYRVPQAAKALGVGVTTINKLIRKGELQSVKIGKCRAIPADALREFLNREGVKNG